MAEPQRTLSKTFILFALPIYGVFAILYSPTIFAKFLFLDDSLFYSSYYHFPLSQWMMSHGFVGSLRGGRPFTAMAITQLALALKHSNNDDLFFQILRLSNTLMVATACLLFAVWFSYRRRGEFLFPLSVSLLIFLLPGYEVPIAAASPAANTYALPLVFVATCILGLKTSICSQWTDFGKHTNWLRMAGAVLVLVLTLLSYQLYPLAFLIPTLAILLLDRSLTQKQRISVVVSHLLVYGAALVSYEIIFKFVILPLARPYVKFVDIYQMPARENLYPISMKAIINNIIGLFSGHFWGRSGDLWVVSEKSGVAHAVYLFIGVSAIVCLIKWFINMLSGLKFQREAVPMGMQVAALFLMLYVGMNIVNLRLEPNWSYRGVAPNAAVVVLLLVWSASFWTGLLPTTVQRNAGWAWAGGMAIIAGWTAQYNTMQYFTLPLTRELAIFQTALEPLIFGRVQEVNLLLPQDQDVLGDEFTRLNTTSGVNVIGGLVEYVHHQFGVDYNYRRICFIPEGSAKMLIVDFGYGKSQVSTTVDVRDYKCHDLEKNAKARLAEMRDNKTLTAYTVNLRRFQLVRQGALSLANDTTLFEARLATRTLQFRSGPFDFYPEGDQVENHTIDKAMDGSVSTDSFWQDNGPFPIDVTIRNHADQPISSYWFQSSTDPAGAPTSWRLQGSSDGKDWHLVDEVTDSKPWAANERRQYRIGNPQQYAYYRIQFTHSVGGTFLRIQEMAIYNGNR